MKLFGGIVISNYWCKIPLHMYKKLKTYTSLCSGQLVSTSQMIFGPKNQVKTISIWLLWFWKGKLLGGGFFFLCLIEKKRNIFSPPRRKPPAIFDQKDFAVIVHSVPKVEIIFLFKFEKKKLFCSIICSMYCRKHEFFDVFYTI